MTKFLIVIVAIIVIWICFNKKRYREIRNGEVGPLIYVAKAKGRFIPLNKRIYMFKYVYKRGRGWIPYVLKAHGMRLEEGKYIFFIKTVNSFDEIVRMSHSWADENLL